MNYKLLINFLSNGDIICKRCLNKIEMLIEKDGYMENYIKLKSYNNMISYFFDVVGEEPTVVYLVSKYKDKDMIKSLGGRWDGVKKKWYFTYTSKNEEIVNKFSQWIPVSD